MGGKTKKGKGRLDKFYHLAKEQGYRSRAAFKLVQLNRKYNFLGNCRALLDLCAAPGGWLQVAAQNMPMASLIVGVDLVPIKPIRGVKTMLGDITTQACRSGLKKMAGGSSFDVVVHDGAPNVGGAWSQEAYSQAALVLDSLRLATEFLAPKGTFVSKVFRSKDYNALLYAFNQLFAKVESTKPTASRNASAEIFVVCQGYKAPAKIDPRLLDPRHLFQEVADAPRVMGPEALLRQKIKQHRHRGGYEEGLSSLRKVVPALVFLSASAPVEMLGQVTQIVLDGPGSWEPVPALPHAKDLKELAHLVRQHAATTHEVRALCADLQVLGRSEFKALLKWRMAVLKDLAKEMRQATTGVEEDEEAGKKGKKGVGEGEEATDPEEAMLQEMAEVKAAVAQREKRERKKQREAKRKARVRTLQMGLGQAAPIDDDDDGPDSMFSLRKMTGDLKTLARVADAPVMGDKELEALEVAGSSDDAEESGDSSDNDESEDEEAAQLREELENEEALEESYKAYLRRKGHREDIQKEKRKRLGMDGELDEEEEEEAGGHVDGEDASSDEDADNGPRASKRQKQDAGKKSKKQQQGQEGAGLLVSLDESRAGVAKSGAAMAAQWFSQELFDDPNLAGDEDGSEDSDEGGRAPAATQQRSAAGSKRDTPGESRKAARKAGEAAEEEEEEKSEEEPAGPLSGGSTASAKKTGRGKDGFEVVPQQKQRKKGDDSDGSGTDSDDEFDALDDQGKAEVLALAKRMLHRKEKESIMDAAYNRYAFHDAGMPRWFTEDEAKHMRPILPVTKEEVEAEKARLKAVDARPIKKVAEAKARQHRKAVSRLQSAREKAESIAAQEDVPMNSKMREIERIYARARAGGKKGKGKGGKDGKRGGKKGKGPPMDKRMLKDKRAAKAADKRNKGKKGRGKK